MIVQTYTKEEIDRLIKRIEDLEAAATYLSAEVKDAWDQHRISFVIFHAALAMDRALVTTGDNGNDK